MTARFKASLTILWNFAIENDFCHWCVFWTKTTETFLYHLTNVSSSITNLFALINYKHTLHHFITRKSCSFTPSVLNGTLKQRQISWLFIRIYVESMWVLTYIEPGKIFKWIRVCKNNINGNIYIKDQTYWLKKGFQMCSKRMLKCKHSMRSAPAYLCSVNYKGDINFIFCTSLHRSMLFLIYSTWLFAHSFQSTLTLFLNPASTSVYIYRLWFFNHTWVWVCLSHLTKSRSPDKHCANLQSLLAQFNN